MTIRVRPATIADDVSVARVHVLGWRETYPGILPRRTLARLDIEGRRRFWHRIIADHGNGIDVFVAELEDEVVGFGVCGPEQAGLKDYPGEFHALYVLRAGQGRGIGRQLMAAMAECLRRRGFGRATVWTLRENWRARRFYEKLGGKLIADRPLDFDGAVVMEVAYAWDDVLRVAHGAWPPPYGSGP